MPVFPDPIRLSPDEFASVPLVDRFSPLVEQTIVREGRKWVLYSKDGKKKLGEFDSREAALQREREIQYFKHAKAIADDDEEPIDIGNYEPSEADLDSLYELLVKTDLLERSEQKAKSSGGNVGVLVRTFGKWAGGTHRGCVAKLKGQPGIADPERLCAWLKDRYKGSTSWRGKKEKSAPCPCEFR